MENVKGSLIHDGGLLGFWLLVQCMNHFVIYVLAIGLLVSLRG
jgi:hypothetical protein